MLMALYLFNVFAVGYIVFALERLRGKCMGKIDAYACFLTPFRLHRRGVDDGSDNNKPRFWRFHSLFLAFEGHYFAAFASWNLSDGSHCWSAF